MIGSAASIPIAGVRRGGSIQASRQTVTKLSAIPQVGIAFVGLTAPVGRLVAYSPAEFIQSAIATKFANSVTVPGDLVHIAGKEMKEGEAYFERNKETLVHHYEGKYIALWENRV
ncbi:MAG TPA: hypothetical protein VJ441_03075, partial [Dehalococcoidia bacterium]|nr:hypothetical protein [Dehalococcoidia bacterium]